MTTYGDTVACGRLDVADAYRRLADMAVQAAAMVSDPDSNPGDEQSAYLTVEDCLLTIGVRRSRLDAARRGAARGRAAGAP